MRKASIVFLVLAMTGCGAVFVSDEEVAEKKKELVSDWRKEANAPEPTPVPPEIEKLIDSKLSEWREEEGRKRAASTGLTAAGKAATGDWIGLLLLALGIGGNVLKNRKAA